MNKKRIIISLFLVFVLFSSPLFFSYPKVLANPDAISEYIFTDAFDNTVNEWDVVGSSPYLDAQDYPTAYLWGDSQAGAGLEAYYFMFPNITGVSINSMNISLYSLQSAELAIVNLVNSTHTIEVFNYDLVGSGVWIVATTDSNNDSLLATIPTIEEFNGMKMKVSCKSEGGSGACFFDALRVGVNYNPIPDQNLTVVFQEGLTIYVNDSAIANNSQTQFTYNDVANITAVGNFNAFLWEVSGNHNHTETIFKLMDMNYTVTAINFPTVAAVDDTTAIFIMAAIVLLFILAFVLAFRRK